MAEKDRSEEPASCGGSCQPVQVPSEDEQVALSAMKGIKERVREIKRRLSVIPSSGKVEDTGERVALEEEMAQLKGAWKVWEERRQKAAKERMILLGHEK